MDAGKVTLGSLLLATSGAILTAVGVSTFYLPLALAAVAVTGLLVAAVGRVRAGRPA